MPKMRQDRRPEDAPVIDGRSAQARRIAKIRKQLTAQVGGQPTASQRLLIDRAAVLATQAAHVNTAPLNADAARAAAALSTGLASVLTSLCGDKPAQRPW